MNLVVDKAGKQVLSVGIDYLKKAVVRAGQLACICGVSQHTSFCHGDIEVIGTSEHAAELAATVQVDLVQEY